MSLLFKQLNNQFILSRQKITCAEEDNGFPEDYELYKHCVKEFKKREFLSIIKMDYELGRIMKPIKKIKEKTKDDLLKFRADKRLDRYIFLTINPPENKILPKDLVKLCIKAMSRKFIVKYHFVIEQRGITLKEMGKGLHAHLLFERDIHYKPAIIKRDLKNTFKNCFNKISNHNFNFKKCGKEFYLKRLEYIKGNKTEDGKDIKMKVDKHFRFCKKIKKIYKNKEL